MDYLEQHNLREIDGLNQRGGRTLSLVDLVEAGTVSDELVAHCWTAIAHGASFLTAARPGGAGKSTVLANLLALLPAGERVATWSRQAREERIRSHVDSLATQGRDRQEVFRELNLLLQAEFLGSAPGDEADADEPTCWLAHEIGAGHWHGYIWGSDVPWFLSRKSAGSRVASCLHADTLEETRQILLRPPLNVSEEALGGIDLLLYIHLLPQRRVALVYEATEEGHRLAFSLNEEGALKRHGASQLFPRLRADEAEYEARLGAVQEIVQTGERDFARVREQVLAYGRP